MKRREFSIACGAFWAGGKITLANNANNLWVPPEEAPHERTFMQWPVSPNVHPDPVFLEMLQDTIADIANTIVEFEPITILMAKAQTTKAMKKLSNKVEVLDIETEDLWARDSGPLFAINQRGQRVISHIRFNGWGQKQIHEHDSAIVEQISRHFGIPIIDSGIVGEAGGIEHDGHGLLAAHESSFLNPNRNPGLKRNDIEERLLKAYGAQKMIWSKGVYGNDITDYHIDSLARFTGPGRILINLPEEIDIDDPFHQAAIETQDALATAGIEIDVIPEPVQRRVRSLDFVASYTNYYACNDAIIAAQFGDPETDEIALESLSRHYPKREIVMLNVDPLGEIGGGIHCATQQMPMA